VVFARRIARITRYYPHEYPEAERRFLEPWIWENRRAGLEVVKPDVPHAVLCSGCVDPINFHPDGSAWPCILERQLRVTPLSNVLEPGFERLSSPTHCAESWQCDACDGDKMHISSRYSGD
jgi:hypothetical protein